MHSVRCRESDRDGDFGKNNQNTEIFGSNSGFQRLLSPKVTMVDVNAVVKIGNNKIARLELMKAYDRIVCIN